MIFFCLKDVLLEVATQIVGVPLHVYAATRSDLDLKNLPQTGIGSKRCNSALTLSSLKLKFLVSKKEVLITVTYCTTKQLDQLAT